MSMLDLFLDAMIGRVMKTETNEVDDRTFKLNEFQCLERNHTMACHAYANVMIDRMRTIIPGCEILQRNCVKYRYPDSCLKYAHIRSGMLVNSISKEDPPRFPELNPSVALDFLNLACKYGRYDGCYNAAIFILNGVKTTEEAGLNSEYNITPSLETCPSIEITESGQVKKVTPDYSFKPEFANQLNQSTLDHAIELLKLSCENKIMGGCLLLSNFYANGFHNSKRKPDLDQSYFFLKDACKHGSDESCLVAVDLILNGKAPENDPKIANQLIEMAEDRSNSIDFSKMKQLIATKKSTQPVE